MRLNTIRKKLIASYAILLFIVLVIGITSIVFLVQVRTTLQLTSVKIDNITWIANLQTAFGHLSTPVIEYMYNNDPEERAEFEEIQRKIFNGFYGTSMSQLTRREKELLQDLKPSMDEFIDICHKILSMTDFRSSQQKISEEEDLIEQMEEINDKIITDLGEIQSLSIEEVNEYVSKLKLQQYSLMLFVITLTVTGAIACMILAVLASRKILGSIDSLVEFAITVSKGNLITTSTSDNEDMDVKILYDHLNEMVSSLKHIAKWIKETNADIKSVAHEVIVSANQQRFWLNAHVEIINKTKEIMKNLRQTIAGANDRAKSVALMTQEGVSLCQSGQKTVGKHIDNINLVMEKLGLFEQNIIALGKRAGQIENRYGSSNNIARNSNTLTPNVSAMNFRVDKCGEELIIALEIKSLVKQSSKEAGQIEKSLTDIQQIVNNTTEQILDISEGQAMIIDNLCHSIENIKHEAMENLSTAERTKIAADSLINLSVKMDTLLEKCNL